MALLTSLTAVSVPDTSRQAVCCGLVRPGAFRLAIWEGGDEGGSVAVSAWIEQHTYEELTL